MSIVNHIVEHQKIGSYGLGLKSNTIGVNGKYPDIATALSALGAEPDLTSTVTYTASSRSTSSSTEETRIITADASTPLSGFTSGEIVGLTITGHNGGYPCIGWVVDDTNIVMKNPFLTDVSSVSITVGYPNWRAISVLPGHVEDITGSPTLKSFMSISCSVPGTARAVGGFQIFGSEIAVSNLDFYYEGTGGQCMNVITPYQGDLYISKCRAFNTSIDWLYYANGDQGGLIMRNCEVNGRYDNVRLRSHREVYIEGNRFQAESHSSVDAQGTCIALGITTAPTAMPKQEYTFIGNTFIAYGESWVANTPTVEHGPISGIDIRNRLGSDAKVKILSNNFYIRADSNSNNQENAMGVSCTEFTTYGAETPEIFCSNNIFDVANYDVTGNAYCMHSEDANYDIQTAQNNIDVNGTGNGTNVTAVASWPTAAHV